MARKKLNKICTIHNCETKHYSLGYCHKHYLRFKKYSNPLFVKNVIGENRCKNELYIIYHEMKNRCLNSNHKRFKDYGGRGITISECWMGVTGFNNFCEDMGDRPTKKHSIDRKDNDKGYSKDNCRWATKSEQSLNRRNSNKHPYIYFNNRAKKWVIQKKTDGKRLYFGLYPTKLDAIEATIELGLVIK